MAEDGESREGWLKRSLEPGSPSRPGCITALIILAIILILTLKACFGGQGSGDEISSSASPPPEANTSATDQPPPSAAVAPSDDIAISVRTTADTPPQPAALRPIGRDKYHQIADQLRQSGFTCNTVTGFYSLVQDGEVSDVFKVECDTGAFQLTMMNDHVFIKPWDGVILGKADGDQSSGQSSPNRDSDGAAAEYKEQCLKALEDGSNPSVASLTEAAKEQMCADPRHP